ncbi:MAG: hypothetical protein UX14_C0008G0012 [Parcubacteria group bacterium GW2011_GWF1_45_5]|nr:MAG: hypothetical protein UX14_C0008G0012 [Parcubacteria group bacterium GW2011_GWF1_45_5]
MFLVFETGKSKTQRRKNGKGAKGKIKHGEGTLPKTPGSQGIYLHRLGETTRQEKRNHSK